MGILNSDIGYQIGLLAGGLWAERYRQRGEQKENKGEPFFNEDLFYQNAHEHLMNAMKTPTIFNAAPYSRRDFR